MRRDEARLLAVPRKERRAELDALLQEKAVEDAQGWGGFFAIFGMYDLRLAFPLS